MTRLIFSSVGSVGDVLPLIGPARALRDRGHDVRFALSPDLVGVARSLGFDAVAVGPAMRLAEEPRMQRMLTMRGGGYYSARHLIEDWLAPSLPTVYHDLRAACEGATALVASSTQLAAGWVARELDICWVTLSVQPLAIPSAYITPPPAFASHRLVSTPSLNRLRWRFAEVGMRRLERPLERVARQLGHPPLKGALIGGALSPRAIIILSSPHYSPRQPDWPDQTRVTGFTLWEDGSEVPAEVAAFLGAEDPPIVVTLGSAASLLAGGFFAAAATAAQRAGRRCLAIVGHEENLNGRFPGGTLAVLSAPLTAVLRRGAMLIHHGGFGSTAAALSVGVPQLVVPWAFEQPFHGQRIHELGCGRMLRRPTPARLQAATTRVIEAESYGSRAHELAMRIQAENGIAAAAAAIESAIARPG